MSAAYSSTANGLTAPSSWKRRRSWPSRAGLGAGDGRWSGGPERGHQGERGLERGRLVGDGLVIVGRGGADRSLRGGGVECDDPSRSGPDPGGRLETGDPELAEPRELDHDRLVERLETEPRLELDVIGPAQPRVRASEALARSRGLTFGPAKPVAVGGVGGVDLGQGLASGRLAGRRRGDLGAKGVALLGQRSLTLTQRRQVGIGAGHPLFGQGRGRLGTDPPVLGIPARGVADAGLLGEAIPAGPQLHGPSLPGRQRGPRLRSDRFGGGRVRRHVRRLGLERRDGRPGAIQLGGKSHGLGLVPRRLPDDGLEPSRDQAFGFLRRSPRALGPALLGAGRLDRIGRRLRCGRQPDRHRPQVPDFGIERSPPLGRDGPPRHAVRGPIRRHRT